MANERNDLVAERFGKNLRDCRRSREMSQEETGVRASLHRTGVAEFESGKRLPRLDTLIQLAGALEADPGELLKGIRWKPGMTKPGGFELSSRRISGR